MMRSASLPGIAHMAGALLMLSSVSATAAFFDIAPPYRDKVATVVAQVGSVWPQDEMLNAFHEELKGRYSDTPELAEFKEKERWLSAFSSRSIRYPGVFNARSKASDNVQPGDIVKMRIVNFRRISSYFELSRVEEVLCRTGTPDFDACVSAYPLAWFNEAGERLEEKPK